MVRGKASPFRRYLNADGGKMKKRILTGLVIFAALIVFFLLKIYVQVEVFERKLGGLFFDAFIMFMAGAGAYEMTRAFKEKMVKAQRILAVVFPLGIFPLVAFIGLVGAIIWTGLIILVTLGLFIFDYKNITIESVAYTILVYCYPTLILSFLVSLNHMEDIKVIPYYKFYTFEEGLCALMLIFVVSPFADMFAFFVGSAVKGRKLSPEISPNKTVSGAIGGIFGGTLGGVIAYFIPQIFGYVPAYFGVKALNIVFFAAMGAVCALLTEFGDLVESAIKRRLGVKDMGKLLPGHGGMMDRIDGFLFACPVVVVVFCVILPMFMA